MPRVRNTNKAGNRASAHGRGRAVNVGDVNSAPGFKPYVYGATRGKLEIVEPNAEELKSFQKPVKKRVKPVSEVSDTRWPDLPPEPSTNNTESESA